MTRDIDFTQAEQDDGYRADLEAIVQEKGAAYLHQMLAEVDPSAGMIPRKQHEACNPRTGILSSEP